MDRTEGEASGMASPGIKGLFIGRWQRKTALLLFLAASIALAAWSVGRATQSDVAEEGKRLYQTECARCHGEAGNRIPIVPLNSPEYMASLGDAKLMSALADGRNTMPAFGTERGGALKAAQIESIVLYMRSPQGLVRGIGSPGTGDGRGLYVSKCASCHGLDGAKMTQTRIGSEEYLNSRGESSVSRVVLTGQGAMPAFASSLDAGQVEVILGYLKSLGSGKESALGTATGSSLRASGSLQPVPHLLNGRENFCLVCHGEAGLKPFPGDHKGRSARTCLNCHENSAASQATPAVPRVAHGLQGQEQCLACHGPKGMRPTPASHAGRPNEGCLQCHRPPEPTAAGDLPRMPHDKQGREDCRGCHEAGFLRAMPADHQGRPADQCQSCHKPAPVGSSKPMPQIKHDTARAEDCLLCHGPKSNSPKATPATPS